MCIFILPHTRGELQTFQKSNIDYATGTSHPATTAAVANKQHHQQGTLSPSFSSRNNNDINNNNQSQQQQKTQQQHEPLSSPLPAAVLALSLTPGFDAVARSALTGLTLLSAGDVVI